jgi:hypothetical protein
MRRLFLSISVLILVLAAAAGRADTAPNAPIIYKAKAGESARYKSEGSLNMQAGGQKVTLDLKEVEKVTFTQVASNGDITMEHEPESIEMTFNGQKSPPPEGERGKTTVVIHKDGSLVSYKPGKPEEDKDHTQARLFVATTPVFADKVVGPGGRCSSRPDSPRSTARTGTGSAAGSC